MAAAKRVRIGSETNPEAAQRDYDTLWLLRSVDDRKEATDPNIDRRARARARSVCAVIPASKMSWRDDRKWVLVASTLADRYNMDLTEPFRDQPAAAEGGAFLVGPNTVATALHVAERIDRGQRIRFVFGYDIRRGPTPTVFKADDVYTGINVCAGHRGSDTALVQLDREVTGRDPLRLRLDQPIGKEEPIYVIGFPAGLPAKYADNARAVPNRRPRFFSANLDVISGNSGSPVFSRRHHDVVGIVSRAPSGLVTFRRAKRISFDRASDYEVVISRITNLREAMRGGLEGPPL